MERQSEKPGDSKRALAEERTELALRRTIFAADRTLLAWVRTSLALMTFGFSIYKFFQYLEESGAVSAGWQPTGPRRFGMILVTVSTVLLVWQTWQYYQLLKRLSRKRGKRRVPKTPTLVAGGAVILLGFATFASIFFGIRLF